MHGNSSNFANAPGASVTDTSRTGLLVVGLGGMALSFDIPLIRLSGAEFWTVLLIRGVLISGAAIAYWAFRRFVQKHRTKLVDGWKGALVTIFYAVGVTSFLYSIYHTAAANTVFILAFNAVFAALFGWVLFGEKPSRTTLVVIPATIFGVALIIGSGVQTGNWTGDLAALNAAFFIALALVISRGSRRDMRYAAALGSIVPAVIAVPFVASAGFHSDAPIWLVLNGGVVIPLALICLAAAPMFVAAPIVALGYLLETVFAPVWIWLVFGERPADLAFVGGGIILAALTAQTIAEMRSAGRSVVPSEAGSHRIRR